MFNREIEWPFELCEILVVVNEPTYHTPEETLIVYTIESESRFERGRSYAVNRLTKERLRILGRGCAEPTPARLQAIIKKQRVSDAHICAGRYRGWRRVWICCWPLTMAVRCDVTRNGQVDASSNASVS